MKHEIHPRFYFPKGSNELFKQLQTMAIRTALISNFGMMGQVHSNTIFFFYTNLTLYATLSQTVEQLV